MKKVTLHKFVKNLTKAERINLLAVINKGEVSNLDARDSYFLAENGNDVDMDNRLEKRILDVLGRGIVD